MSKKNSKTSIKKRMNIIKNEYMINNKKKELRRDLKGLQKQMKSQFLKLNLGVKNGNEMGETPEIEMKAVRRRNRGINFSRSFDSSTPLRARDKKVIQRALKRKKNLTMELN